MKRALSVFLIAALLLTLCSCTAKLTTVRPAEISELRVEKADGSASVTLPSEKLDADLKDRLIFQLEEPYNKTGRCSEEDDHVYIVTLYIGDKLDTRVFINSDGSACKNGKRYLPMDIADEPISLADWDALFN